MNKKKNHLGKSRVSTGAYRFLFSANLLIALFLALVLVGMLNYLASNHYLRLNLSGSDYYTLSAKSSRILNNITNDVQVYAVFPDKHILKSDVRNLLSEYQSQSSHLDVEWIDPDSQLARTEELTHKYDLDSSGRLIVVCGDRTVHLKRDDIADFKYQDLRGGGRQATLENFKGEVAISSAILSVTANEKPLVYYSQGHAEREFDNFDPHEGYSSIARLIRQNNISLKPLDLNAKTIPADCSALIIAAPQKRFTAVERKSLEKYLDRGGRALILLDALMDPGLADILEKWGVVLQHDLVVDPGHMTAGSGVLLQSNTNHPIVDSMQGLRAVFYRPRSVEPTLVARLLDSPDRPDFKGILSCSKAGWAESSPKEKPITFEPSTPDRAGPISVMASIEKGGVAELDVQIKPTRLVVCGDSDFVSNGAFSGGNRDLFLGALEWLLDREELIGITPKSPQDVKINLKQSQLERLFILVVLGLPGVIAISGLVVWARRSRA